MDPALVKYNSRLPFPIPPSTTPFFSALPAPREHHLFKIKSPPFSRWTIPPSAKAVDTSHHLADSVAQNRHGNQSPQVFSMDATDGVDHNRVRGCRARDNRISRLQIRCEFFSPPFSFCSPLFFACWAMSFDAGEERERGDDDIKIQRTIHPPGRFFYNSTSYLYHERSETPTSPPRHRASINPSIPPPAQKKTKPIKS